MAITFVLDGARLDDLYVQASPLAELNACLHAYHQPEHHPLSKDWAYRVQGLCDERLEERLQALQPLWGPYRPRYFFPLEKPSNGTKTLDEELEQVADLPVDDFVAMTGESIIGRSQAGGAPLRPHADKRAAKWLLKHARFRSTAGLSLAEWLLHDPETLRHEMLDLLRDFANAAFRSECADRLPELRRETHRTLQAMEQHGPAVLRALSPTAMIHHHPTRVVYDKLYHAVVRLQDRPCVLVPSWHVSPHLVIKHSQGWPIVIQHTVHRQEAAEPIGMQGLRNRLRALNDPTRIEICRALVRRPYSTAELAMDMGMPAPQISRHLSRLRDAGLVRSRREGRLVLYELNTTAVGRLGGDILGVLHR